jgi:mRNA interferase HicA
MKTKDFIKFLNQQQCFLIREGSNHSTFQNQKNKKITSAPRHKEVKNNLAGRCVVNLEIPPPESFQ